MVVTHYQLRHCQVEAIRWHPHAEGDNTDDIIEFARGHIYHVSDFAIRFTADLTIRALIRGDWAVKNAQTGMITALPDDDFHRKYIAVDAVFRPSRE